MNAVSASLACFGAHLDQPGGLPAPQQIASAAQHVGFAALDVYLHERHAVRRLGHQIDGEQIDALALAFRTQKMVRRVALELQDTRSGRRSGGGVMADHLCAVRACIGFQAHEIAKLGFNGDDGTEVAEDGVWDRRQSAIRHRLGNVLCLRSMTAMRDFAAVLIADPSGRLMCGLLTQTVFPGALKQN